MIELLLACAGPDEETGPPPDDTAEVDPCPDGARAVFADIGGVETDLTDALTTGEYTTLDQSGTLTVCPGTWFARLVIREDLTVRGLGKPEDTVLSGGESGTILDILGPSVTVTVQDLTLDRGAGLDKDHNSGGGGIYCEGVKKDTTTQVVVNNVIFSNHFANDGAGLYAVNCGSTVTDSVFVDNLSEDDGGSYTAWYSTVTLERVHFENNQGLDGGAMALFYSDAVLTDVTFEANVATHIAGAIWQYQSTLSMTGGGFTANDIAVGDAGALLAYGDTTLDGVTFDGNIATHGGGLFVYYDSTLAATDCSFTGNTVDDVYAADYSEAGGVSYVVAETATFSCAANVCTGI